MHDEAVMIVSGARTPMGGLLGDLSPVPAPELAAVASRAALEKAALPPDAVNEVFMGCVLPAGLKQCPARQTAMATGIPAGAGVTGVGFH